MVISGFIVKIGRCTLEIPYTPPEISNAFCEGVVTGIGSAGKLDKF
jgi:hypothetical protein